MKTLKFIFLTWLINAWKYIQEKIRLMIIRTLKNVSDSLLKYYYIEFRFFTMDNQNSYKLPMITHVVDLNEAIHLQQNIYDALRDRKFNVTDTKSPQEIFDLNKTIEEINVSQQINGYVTIRIILDTIDIKNGITSVYHKNKKDIKEFKVNIIGKEKIPFELIKDLFVIELNKSALES